MLSKAAELPPALTEDARLAPFGIAWVHLPENVGKESESYLQYIVLHHATLPDYVLFSQVRVCAGIYPSGLYRSVVLFVKFINPKPFVLFSPRLLRTASTCCPSGSCSSASRCT